jgi:hypothetical protein
MRALRAPDFSHALLDISLAADILWKGTLGEEWTE